MTWKEAFEQSKQEVIGDNLVITSIDEAEALHKRFIKLRTQLIDKGLIEIIPHYRGEQKYGWNINPGIFRPPLTIKDAATGKTLERTAIVEFERVIHEKVGMHALRDIFENEKYGKDWNLLFQAQHAGIRTTLTDWSAEILSALFFATEKSDKPEIENSHGQLWCFITPEAWIYGHNANSPRRTFYDLNPFNLKQAILVNSPYYLTNIKNRTFEHRMFRQKGRFVMPSADSCNIPLNQQSELKLFFFKARIPAVYKQTIRDELAEMNVIRENMYINESLEIQILIMEINKAVFRL